MAELTAHRGRWAAKHLTRHTIVAHDRQPSHVEKTPMARRGGS